jgi:hypothetical protein
VSTYVVNVTLSYHVEAEDSDQALDLAFNDAVHDIGVGLAKNAAYSVPELVEA